MKKYKVIYNPSSGNELVQNKIFQISKNILVSEDVTFTFYATKKEGDAQKAMTKLKSQRPKAFPHHYIWNTATKKKIKYDENFEEFENFGYWGT